MDLEQRWPQQLGENGLAKTIPQSFVVRAKVDCPFSLVMGQFRVLALGNDQSSALYIRVTIGT